MITLCAGSALGVVPGPHEQQAGQLAGRAGRRLQGGGGHAGDLAQGLLELDAAARSQPWVRRGRRGRVDAGQARAGAARSSHSLGLYFMVHEPERVGAEVDGVLAVASGG